jgi:hypothetical protein
MSPLQPHPADPCGLHGGLFRGKLCVQYKGLWVALSEDDNETVVGSGATPEEALDQARGKAFTNAAVTFVPVDISDRSFGLQSGTTESNSLTFGLIAAGCDA